MGSHRHALEAALIASLLLLSALVAGVSIASPHADRPVAATPAASSGALPLSHESFHPSFNDLTMPFTSHPLNAAAVEAPPPLSPLATQVNSVATAASPMIRSSWAGIASADNAYLTPFPSASPPDVQVAVGSAHVVEMVNFAVTMWTKAGAFVKNESLMGFFGVASNELISDPKVQYDAASGRWFASVTDVGTVGSGGSITPTGQVFLAVSEGSDPTGAWRVLGILPSATGECYDQPILGVGNATVILSVNRFSSCVSSTYTYYGAQYWVFSKADLVAGVPSPGVQVFGPYAGTASIHPAQVIGTSSSDYLVSANAFQSSVTSVEVFRVTGTPPNVLVSTSNLTVRTIANPPAAPQLNGAYPLDAGDLRILDAVWSGGRLWLSLDDSCVPSGDQQARSCVRLIEIDTVLGSVAQDFDVGAAGEYYLYPALRVDSQGDLLVVFGYSSPTEFPGLMAAGRVFGDAPGHLDPPELVAAGTAAQPFGCSGTARRCRYGDYFGAALDPSNASVIWAAGESANSQGWTTQLISASVKALLTFDFHVVNGNSGYEPPAISYTLDGIPRSATLGSSPTVYAADPGTVWSVPGLLYNPDRVVNRSSEVWAVDATEGAPPSSGVVTASLSANFTYFHMYLFRFGFAVPDTSGQTPMVQLETMNLSRWAVAGASYYADAGSSFSYPALLNQSTASERWILEGPAIGTVTGPDGFAGVYYHQYQVTFGYVVLGGGSGLPAPMVSYSGLGANSTVRANATAWADAARPYAYAPSLSGEGGGVRIGPGAGASGSVTSSGTITVTYRLQYLLQVAADPATFQGNVIGAGWYDAGTAALLTATAPNGWKLAGWSGAASGTTLNVTILMNGVANVTAVFYPGLTIVAGGGGSVAYSYGGSSGVVPAGGSFTLYAPVGSTVTLTAEPSFTQAFVSWTGAASGAATTTSVTLNGPLSVTATFGTNGILVAGIAGGVIATILAVVLVLLVLRRRKRRPPP